MKHMGSIITWLFPSDPIALTVLPGVIILSAVSAMVGCFTLLRKRALAGDAIAHAVLPGICIAFLLTSEKSAIWFMGGAIGTGWLSLWTIELITTHTRLKADTATALVLSTFFGLGIVLLTLIQHSGMGAQSGLDRFLFGRAAAMTGGDVEFIIWVGALITITITLLFNRFSLLSFDPAFAQSIGLPLRALSFVLSLLTVTVVAIGIQAVGVVLMAALLVTPAAAARVWTNRLPVMALVAGAIGALAGWLGTGISIGLRGMPTGPWIVIMASLLAGMSFIAAPRNGLFARWLRSRHFRKKVDRENLLKAFYALHTDPRDFVREGQLEGVRQVPEGSLRPALRRLRLRSLAESDGGGRWRLTEEGRALSTRVVRLHRLWELYLNRRLGLPPDHVHHSADAIEHIITPELEKLLSSDLGHPGSDPHDQPIPGPSSSSGLTTPPS